MDKLTPKQLSDYIAEGIRLESTGEPGPHHPDNPVSLRIVTASNVAVECVQAFELGVIVAGATGGLVANLVLTVRHLEWTADDIEGFECLVCAKVDDQGFVTQIEVETSAVEIHVRTDLVGSEELADA